MLTYLTETWKRETGPWNVIGVVFIDFKKAFARVSHSVVNVKLPGMGFSGPALNWLRDYLDGRKQFAVVNGSKKEMNMINCGIPQGSLLGPMIF